MDNEFDDENALYLYMEPSTIGEALEDFLKKIEVIPEDAQLDKISMPLGVEEDGTVPVVVTLKEKNTMRLN